VLDAVSGRSVRTAVTGWQPGAVAVDEAHQKVFVVNSYNVSILDGRNGTILRTVPLPQGAFAIPQTNVAVDTMTGRALVGAQIMTFSQGTSNMDLITSLKTILARVLGGSANVSTPYIPPVAKTNNVVIEIDATS